VASQDRFKQAVVATLAQRAANRCSNPDCGAITSGPAVEPDGSINVGEAAHIYGANPGSARYRSEMSSDERSDISNGIWLCSTCHKLVDDDDKRYPAGLLFEWQREHGRELARLVGKTGPNVRARYEDRYLESFGKLSYLAERIIVDKDDLWEYRLTAEMLRSELTPVLNRWMALAQGHYVKPYVGVSRDDFIDWIGSKNREALAIAASFAGLINREFTRAWGAPGVPGSDIDIVEVCRLYRETCQSALQWEEDVRFVAADQLFDELLRLHRGTVGRIIDEAAKLPLFLANMLSQTPVSGVFRLDLKLDLPDRWGDDVDRAFRRIASTLKKR
jgi:hypothetical protein